MDCFRGIYVAILIEALAAITFIEIWRLVWVALP